MLEGSRIFITGGAGFIGSHLAERLIDHNPAITLYDNLHRNAVQSSEVARHPRLTLIHGDVLDHHALSEAMRGHDVIYHCAAIAGIDSVGRRPVNTLKVNVLGSVNVLEAALEQDSLRRVVCFSTSEVFGRHADRISENADASVGPPGEARWTYAAGKLAEEHFAAAYRIEHGLPTAVVRPFNVYGPRQVGEGAIRNFIINALRNEPIKIRGDGSAIRAWTYVEDMIEGACRVVTSDEAIGEDFNIGNPNEPISVSDLANRVVTLTNSESHVEYVDARMVDVEVRVPNITKAEKLLGFRPLVDLDEGIIRTAKALEDST